MLWSEQDGPMQGKREAAMDGHIEFARQAKELGADTVVICDTRWVVNAGFHVKADSRFEGLFTSHEFPQFIRDMSCRYEGNPRPGDAIAKAATEKGVFTLCHHLDSLDLEYGTPVPMRFMSRAHAMKVASIAACCTVRDHQESRVDGEAIRVAVEASESNVLLIASGSLSREIRANKDYAANHGAFTISPEFHRHVDLHGLETWKRGEHAAFLKMLPENARCGYGEGSMHDTVMPCGALDWDEYDACCEVVTGYFPSSGTGPTNEIFPVE